jgi:hypothetical protein
MALSANVVRAGFSGGQAKGLNGAIATGLTAAGTVITDALDLVADVNVIGTCAAGAGVQLPSCELGDSVWVYNGGANACKVYPDSSSAQINQVAAGSAISLATNTAMLLCRITTTRWIAVLSA